MRGHGFITVFFLLLLAWGVLGFGSSVQTPSRRVQTPSLTMDLTREYEFKPGEAQDLVIEHSDARIEYAMENSTTINGFYLYLLSPESSVEIENSCISVEFFHPKTGENLKTFEPHMTIADKKESSLELVAEMKLEGKRYRLCVSEEEWLVSPKARTHVVYVDIGELKRIRFEVEVTKSGEVKGPE